MMKNREDQGRLLPFSLPAGVQLGAATAATQIEGGEVAHSWSRWADLGHTKDGSRCSPACDHWNRIAKDTALLTAVGCTTYRFSVEWARIEPARGVFDQAAIDHYRAEVVALSEAGILPLLTLHHFTNPLWFEDSGGWLREDSPEIFGEFVAYVVQNLGDLVAEWVVINEPNVYLFSGFTIGEWPPAHHSMRDFLLGARNLIRAHKRCYLTIHAMRRELGRDDTLVGTAIHIRPFYPSRRNPLDRLVAAGFNHLFHDMFLEGVVRGRYIVPLRGDTAADRATYRELRMRSADTGSFSDFVGINYYSREMIQFALGQQLPFGRIVQSSGPDRNELGWEIFPEGLYQATKSCYERYRIPVYITENGTCDADDRFRARYLYEHLLQVARLAEDGVDVRRYYHWTLMDNFEWAEGVAARFGLIHVDFDTQVRTIRASGRFYARISRERGVTVDCLEEFSEALRHRGATGSVL